MAFPPKKTGPINWVTMTEERKKKKMKKQAAKDAQKVRIPSQDNSGQPQQPRPQNPQPQTPQAQAQQNGTYFLFGRHPVHAALANPKRKFRRLIVTANAGEHLPALPQGLQPQVMDAGEMARMLPRDALHQGMIAEVYPLAEPTLDDLIATGRPIIMLDQVTDPHNVGAILRSAAAFDAAAVITMKHNAPDETGTLAKSASGALEIMPMVKVTNLAQTLEVLKKGGYWVAGLDGTATQTLQQAKMGPKTVLVLGAEGTGLRRLTIETCDLIVKLPISPKMESLNVSNAAAIALYELHRQA